MSEAYTAFEMYHEKEAMRRWDWRHPKPMVEGDDDVTWPHMSDYDEFGLSPGVGQDDECCPTQDDTNCQNSQSDCDDLETSDQDCFASKEGKNQPIESNGDRSSEATNHPGHTDVLLDDHDAETRGDRVGGSHVVCSNHRGELDQGSKYREAKIVWRPTSQPYKINGWSTDNDDKGKDMLVGCMANGVDKRSRTRRADEELDEEETAIVCNMIGESWESLPFPIIIDSGACASVMLTTWCNHVPIQDIPQSKAGGFYRAANGNNIYHEGERIVPMMTQEGSLRDMRFIVCEVSKALASVSQMCRTGHRGVFNPPWSPSGSYIEHINIGERMWLNEEGGLYVLKTKVAPSSRQTGRRTAQDFP